MSWFMLLVSSYDGRYIRCDHGLLWSGNTNTLISRWRFWCWTDISICSLSDHYTGSDFALMEQCYHWPYLYVVWSYVHHHDCKRWLSIWYMQMWFACARGIHFRANYTNYRRIQPGPTATAVNSTLRHLTLRAQTYFWEKHERRKNKWGERGKKEKITMEGMKIGSKGGREDGMTASFCLA